MSLTDALREVNDSSVVPSCIKKAFNTILDELTTVKQERDRLFRENLILRKKIGISLDTPVTDEDDGHNVVDDHNRSKPEPTTLAHLPDMERETERLRSIVISGVPELSSASIDRRVRYDILSVHNILFHIGVDCLPVSVYYTCARIIEFE
ncbi:unnamed protein product [Heligmosomoides polygyrus]|uniref:WASH_WAHD domain-containing protein n=1 Tax=Heligmosomoides polygyrus TaxID=6339 RepID=A0A183FGY8_HELPZ|nr:unnamed protein product [Heligmosomoides polygyrus]